MADERLEQIIAQMSAKPAPKAEPGWLERAGNAIYDWADEPPEPITVAGRPLESLVGPHVATGLRIPLHMARAAFPDVQQGMNRARAFGADPSLGNFAHAVTGYGEDAANGLLAGSIVRGGIEGLGGALYPNIREWRAR